MVGLYSCLRHIYHRTAAEFPHAPHFFGHPGQISYHSFALLTRQVGILIHLLQKLP